MARAVIGCMIFSLAVLLAQGCAQHAGVAPDKAQPEPPSDAQKMLGATLAGAPLAASVFREGERLSFAVDQSAAAAPTPYLAQLDAACDGSNARLIYLDGAQRVYLGSSNGQYAAPKVIPARYLGELKRNAEFSKACTATAAPDWRVVQGTEGQPWILIDRASLQTVVGKTDFWGAYDEPVVAMEKPYNAPYGQKREHYAVDCAKQTFSLLAAYDLDDRHTVTDGKVFIEPAVEPVAGSNADYRLLFTRVCKNPAALAQLPAFKPRNKAPLAMKIPGVTPGVLTAIKRINLPQPGHPLKHVLEVGTVNVKGQAQALHEDRFFDTDHATGQLVVDVRAATYDSSAVTFRGLFVLSEKSVFHGDGQDLVNIQQLFTLSFSGDWQNMPQGAHLSYTRVGVTRNSVAGEYGKAPQTEHCTVVEEVAASTLNPALQGRAKKLGCSVEGDAFKRVETVYYLPDHGWFFHGGITANDLYWETRILQMVE